jgi:hypothetical protein
LRVGNPVFIRTGVAAFRLRLIECGNLCLGHFLAQLSEFFIGIN